MIRALADIYFSINSGGLCPHSILYSLLFAKLGHGDRLRIYNLIGEAWLLLVDNVATLLAGDGLPIVSVPTLLDLVGLLRHLPWDHVDFFIRIYQGAGLVTPLVLLVEAVASSVDQAGHGSTLVNLRAHHILHYFVVRIALLVLLHLILHLFLFIIEYYYF